MKHNNTKEFCKYTKFLLDYHSTQTISAIHSKLVDDFFSPLPENYAKYVFKVCIERLNFFPKVAELNDIFDAFSKNHNKGTYEKERVYNKTKCSICGNEGHFTYYKKANGTYICDVEFYEDYKRNRAECKTYVGVCKCGVGQSKTSRYHRNYEDIFPNGTPQQMVTATQEELEKADLILKNPSVLFG
jgi:hypothetical protein